MLTRIFFVFFFWYINTFYCVNVFWKPFGDCKVVNFFNIKEVLNFTTKYIVKKTVKKT